MKAIKQIRDAYEAPESEIIQFHFESSILDGIGDPWTPHEEA